MKKEGSCGKKKNLFGFSARGYGGETGGEYLLFTYEDSGFREVLKISLPEKNGKWDSRSARGTYIGEVFYLMYGNGAIEAYSLNDGSLLEVLEKKS